jgi:hypothetical protein
LKNGRTKITNSLRDDLGLLITSYNRDIDSFNLGSDVKIIHKQVSDKEAALTILKIKKFIL